MTTSALSSSPGKWTKMVKVTVYLKKKQGISDEEFSRYYAQTHAALAGPVLLKHNCVSYTQFHCMTDKARQPVTSIFGPDVLKSDNPIQIMPFDGCTSFLFANMEDAQRFFHDPETVSVLGPDSAIFTNPATLQIAIGEEFVVIHDGKTQHE